MVLALSFALCPLLGIGLDPLHDGAEGVLQLAGLAVELLRLEMVAWRLGFGGVILNGVGWLEFVMSV